MEWKHVSTNPPAEGQPVFITRNGEKDVAYYNNGSFFFLEYDPHLGVLRKQHVSEKVEYWLPVFEN